MFSSSSRWNGDVPPNIDVDRLERNKQRMKSTLEDIFERYGHDFTGRDDEIDLETGEIVVNNGYLESMPDHDAPEEFSGLLNLVQNAQYHDNFFADAEQRPPSDEEEDELASMCPAKLRAAAEREPSPRPAESPAPFPAPQANTSNEMFHEAPGSVDQMTAMERQIQHLSRQLQEFRQLVTQPATQPSSELDQLKDPKWYAPPLPALPRRYERSKDSIWDAPSLPEPPVRQRKPCVSPVHGMEEVEVRGSVKRIGRPWTAEENELIMELRHQKLLFREIAARLPGRTTAQVVAHWHSVKDRFDKTNEVLEDLEKNSESHKKASKSASSRSEKLPLNNAGQNSRKLDQTDAPGAGQENETSAESYPDESHIAQPLVINQPESNDIAHRFHRSRRGKLSTQSFSSHDRVPASPPAAAELLPPDFFLETTRETAQVPEPSGQSSTQARAKEVREWCKSKIGVTDNPRRPYFCQLCGFFWLSEGKVMSHFSKASGCKALPLRRLRKPLKPSDPWVCVRCYRTWPTKASAEFHGVEQSSCQPMAPFPTTDKASFRWTSPNSDDPEDGPIPPSPAVVIPARPRKRRKEFDASSSTNATDKISLQANGMIAPAQYRSRAFKRPQEDMSDPLLAIETPLAKRNKTKETFATSTPTAPAREMKSSPSPLLPHIEGIMDGSCASGRLENDMSIGHFIESSPRSFVEEAIALSKDGDSDLASLLEEVAKASGPTTEVTDAAANFSDEVDERQITADEEPKSERHGSSADEVVVEQEQLPRSPELAASEIQAPTSPDGPARSEKNFGLDLDDATIESMIEDPDSFIIESTEVDPDPEPTHLIPYQSHTKSESEDELQKASSPCPVVSKHAVTLSKPQPRSSPADTPARRRRSHDRKTLAISLLEKQAPSASTRTPRRQPLTKTTEKTLAKSSAKSAASTFKTPAKPASASKRSRNSSSRKARQRLPANINDVKDSPMQKSSEGPRKRKSRLSDMLLPGGDSDDDLF